MGRSPSSLTPFGRRFQAELATQGLGVRTLARRIADREGRPERVESIRRQLRRYLTDVDPAVPSAPNRWVIEDALGLERDTLADEDEEDELVDVLMAKLVKGLRPLVVELAQAVAA